MLNNIGLPGILLIAVVVLVLFGRGKISGLMGEVGKGITSFKKGISEGKAELEKAEEEAVKCLDKGLNNCGPKELPGVFGRFLNRVNPID